MPSPSQDHPTAAEAIRQARDRRRDLAGLPTDTTENNAPMRASNDALGYVPTQTPLLYPLDLYVPPVSALRCSASDVEAPRSASHGAEGRNSRSRSLDSTGTYRTEVLTPVNYCGNMGR